MTLLKLDTIVLKSVWRSSRYVTGALRRSFSEMQSSDQVSSTRTKLRDGTRP